MKSSYKAEICRGHMIKSDRIFLHKTRNLFILVSSPFIISSALLHLLDFEGYPFECFESYEYLISLVLIGILVSVSTIKIKLNEE